MARTYGSGRARRLIETYTKDLKGEDVQRMFSIGCDGVMIGRAAIANPWIFRQARHYLQTGEHLPAPDPEERINLCIDHLKLSVYHNGLRNAIVPFRKYYFGYLRGLPRVHKLRQELMQLADLDRIIDYLRQCVAQKAQGS